MADIEKEYYHREHKIGIVLLGDKGAGKTTYYDKFDDMIQEEHEEISLEDLNNRKDSENNPTENRKLPLKFGYYFQGKWLRIEMDDTTDDAIGSKERYPESAYEFGIIFLDLSKPVNELLFSDIFKTLRSWIVRMSTEDENGDIELYPWRDDGTLNKSVKAEKRKLNFPFAIVESKSDELTTNFINEWGNEKAADNEKAFYLALEGLISESFPNIFFGKISAKRLNVANVTAKNLRKHTKLQPILLSYFANFMGLSYDALKHLNRSVRSYANGVGMLELTKNYIFSHRGDSSFPQEVVNEVPKKIYFEKHLTKGGEGDIFIGRIKNQKNENFNNVIIKVTLQASEYLLSKSLSETDKTLHIHNYLKLHEKDHPEYAKYFIHIYSKFYTLLPILTPGKQKFNEYYRYLLCDITIMERMPMDLRSLMEYPTNDMKNKKLTIDVDTKFKTSLTKELLNIALILQRMGIVHRDIAPENILIDTRNTLSIKIIDFSMSVYENELTNESKNEITSDPKNDSFKLKYPRTRNIKSSIIKKLNMSKGDKFARGPYYFSTDKESTFLFGRPGYASPELLVFYFLADKFYDLDLWESDAKTENERLKTLVNELPAQYLDYIRTERYGTDDNFFSMGVIIFGLWFGENTIFNWNTSNKAKEFAKATELRLEFIKNMLMIDNRYVELEHQALITKSILKSRENKGGPEFVKDVYNKIKDRVEPKFEDFYVETYNPYPMDKRYVYINTFFKSINIPKELVEEIKTDPILLSIAYIISFLLVPFQENKIDGNELIITVDGLNIEPPNRFTDKKSIRAMTGLIEEYTNFDSHDHSHIFSIVYTPIMNKIRLFSTDDFGEHTANLFLYKNSNYIELRRLEQESHIKKTCGHKLKINKLITHLIRNQEKIKTNHVAICYKCVL